MREFMSGPDSRQENTDSRAKRSLVLSGFLSALGGTVRNWDLLAVQDAAHDRDVVRQTTKKFRMTVVNARLTEFHGVKIAADSLSKQSQLAKGPAHVSTSRPALEKAVVARIALLRMGVGIVSRFPLFFFFVGTLSNRRHSQSHYGDWPSFILNQR